MIVVLLAGGAYAALAYSAYRERQILTKAEISYTQTIIATTGMSIDLYALQNRRPPDSLQELVPKYMEEIPKDAWGNELQYIKLGEEKDAYRVGSLGADQAEGGTGKNADAWSD